MANERKYCDWACVVNLPEGEEYSSLSLSALLQNLKTHCVDLMTYREAFDWPRFAFVGIVHDLDLDANGVAKTPHVHVVLHFEQGIGKTRALGFLACACAGDGQTIPFECISADHLRNLNGAVRYLLHLDHPEKAQYPLTSLIGSSEWYLPFLEREDPALSILNEYRKGVRPLDLIARYGKHWWLSNRVLALDIWKLMHLEGDTRYRPVSPEDF